jgi:hypothetical protein
MIPAFHGPRAVFLFISAPEAFGQLGFAKTFQKMAVARVFLHAPTGICVLPESATCDHIHPLKHAGVAKACRLTKVGHLSKHGCADQLNARRGPMAEDDKKLGWLADLGVTIHEVLRYGFGGLLVYAVAALCAPKETKTALETLGTIISVILAFALGAAIYAASRYTVGELLNCVRERLHVAFSRWRGRGCICRTAYFLDGWPKAKLTMWDAMEAFRTVRDGKEFDQAKQRRFHLQHSELHMLYIAFVVLISGALVLWFTKPTGALVSPSAMAIVALLCLLSGLMGDILVCQQECKALLQVDRTDVAKILVKAEFIKPEHTDAKSA